MREIRYRIGIEPSKSPIRPDRDCSRDFVSQIRSRSPATTLTGATAAPFARETVVCRTVDDLRHHTHPCNYFESSTSPQQDSIMNASDDTGRVTAVYVDAVER